MPNFNSHDDDSRNVTTGFPALEANPQVQKFKSKIDAMAADRKPAEEIAAVIRHDGAQPHPDTLAYIQAKLEEAGGAQSDGFGATKAEDITVLPDGRTQKADAK